MKAYDIRGWDDTPLYYEHYGLPVGEAPVVVLCDGIGCDGFIWKYLLPRLEGELTILHGHYRGHGLSGRPAESSHYTIADSVRDLISILDHAGADEALVLGHSMGVQVSLEVALSHPERVSGLGLFCGSFGRPLDTWHDHDMLRTALPFAKKVIAQIATPLEFLLKTLMPTEIGWQVAQATEVDGRRLRKDDFLPYLEHLANMDLMVFLHMLDEAANHSTEGRLGDVACPALVVGGERDRFTPFWVSEVMAEGLPDAELHMIKDGTHTAPLEQAQLFEVLVDDWMERQGLGPWQAPEASGATKTRSRPRRRRTSSPTG